jgi:hypothetical protein
VPAGSVKLMISRWNIIETHIIEIASLTIVPNEHSKNVKTEATYDTTQRVKANQGQETKN